MLVCDIESALFSVVFFFFCGFDICFSLDSDMLNAALFGKFPNFFFYYFNYDVIIFYKVILSNFSGKNLIQFFLSFDNVLESLLYVYTRKAVGFSL